MRKSLRRILAATLSLATALTMTVGVAPATPAEAALSEGTTFTIAYDLDNEDSSISISALEDSGYSYDTSTKTLSFTDAYEGDTYTMPDPTSDHYTFTGWIDANSADPDNPDEVESEITLTDNGSSSIKATWKPKVYSISYTNLEDETLIGTTPDSYSYSTIIQDITLPATVSTADDGYAVEWSDGTNNYKGGATYAIPAGNTGKISFKETKVEKKYDITYDYNKGDYDWDVDAADLEEFLATLDSEDASTATDKVGVDQLVSGTTYDIPRASDSLTIKKGDSVKRLVGWGTAADATTRVTSVDVSDSSNFPLKAIWEDVFTIEYDLDDGDWAVGTAETDHPDTFAASDSAVTLPTPKKTGYSFVEWRTDADDDSSTITDLDDTTVTGNLTLYAIFKVNKYTIAADVDTATVGDAVLEILGAKNNGSGKYEITVSYADGPTIDLSGYEPTTASKGNEYVFGGWEDVDEGNIVTSIDLSDLSGGAKVNLKAVWYEKYTIIYDLDGGSYTGDTTINITSETLDDPSSYTAIIPTKDKAALFKWVLSGANVSGGDITVDDPAVGQTIDLSGIQAGDTVKLKAGWVETHDVTYKDADGTTLADLADTYLSTATNVTLKAVPVKAGYTVEWSDGTKTFAGGDTYPVSDKGDLTFTAVYTPIEYQIKLTGVESAGSDSANVKAITDLGFEKLSSGGGGGIAPDDPVYAAIMTVEDTITLPALTAKTHYEFTGWDGTEQEVEVSGVTSDKTYVAQFAKLKKLTITFDLDSGEFLADDVTNLANFGYDAGNADQIEVYADDLLGDIALLPAPVQAGKVFAGWTVDGGAEKVMKYEPVVPTDSDKTVALVATWETAVDGETVVEVDGSGASTIEDLTRELKAAMEESLPLEAGETSITKMTVAEDATDDKDDSDLGKKAQEAVSASDAEQIYLSIDITEYIASATESNKAHAVLKLETPLEIVYTPTGADTDNLKAIIREHDSGYQTFTKLDAAPTTPEDATYYVDGNKKIHLYNQLFSDFAFIFSASTLYTLSYDTDGGSATIESTQTDALPATLPSAGTKTGYTFAKWVNPDGSDAVAGATLDADTTLKATWTKDPDPVTPSTPTPGGGGSGSGSASTPSPSPSASPSVSPTPSAAPSTEPTVAPSTEPTVAPATPAAKGTKITAANGAVITSNGDGTAVLSSGKKIALKSVTVNVVSAGGVSYKITSIAAKAFKGNKKLTKVVIGKNVKKIGKQAFYGCKNLKTVIVKTTKLTAASKVGKNSFKGIKTKAVFKLRKKNYKKTLAAFKKKSGAKKPKYKKV